MPHLFDPLALGGEGRISPTDLGLYSDANEAALARVSPRQEIALGYRVPFALRVEAEVGLPTIAVGLITDPFGQR